LTLGGLRALPAQSLIAPAGCLGLAFLRLALPNTVSWQSIGVAVILTGFFTIMAAHYMQRARTEKAGLSRAIEQAAEAVVITDARANIQYVNPAFAAMTGYSAAEAAGRNTRLLKSGTQDPAYYKDLWQTIAAGKVWHGELINRRKDGSLYPEEMTIAPVRDARGTVTNYIAIKQDISVRKAAEKTERFLASIVESIEDAIVGRTTDGTIVSWNRGAQELFGYSAEEVLGRSVSMLVAPDRRDVLPRVDAALARGESTRFEGVAVTKSGKRIDVALSVCPIRDAQGQVTAASAILRDITARKQAEEMKDLLASIVESSDDAIIGKTLDGTIVSWNQGAAAMYGYRADEVIGKPISILARSGTADEQSQILDNIAQGKPVSHLETHRLKKNGAEIRVSLSVSPIKNREGAVVGASIIARDMTERLLAEEALRRSEAKYRSLVGNIPDVVWTADAAGRSVFVSSNSEKLCGYTPEEIVDAGIWFDRIHPEDMEMVRAAYGELLARRRPYSVEYRIQRKDGQWIWIQDRATTTYEKNGVRYIDGIVSDITGRKGMEATLAHQATHDPLTGLPNRSVCEDRLRQALSAAQRGGNMVAVLHLGLDGLPLINQTQGQGAGDAVLRLAAQRLAGCLRESEIVSGLGGDKFVVILSNVDSPGTAVVVAERIFAALGEPFRVMSGEVFLKASIGIALYPRDGESARSLQQSAESAMWAAKRQGKNRYQMFTAEMSVTAAQRLAMEGELHHAVQRNELALHYQPQFELATDRIVGVEALLRWENPKFGRVPPSLLIPVAEESGLIGPISAWVVGEACRQGRAWADAGCPPVKIAVNIPASLFAGGGLIELVKSALSTSGLDPAWLDLELTESVVMRDVMESVGQLAELRALGVSISLDDFGTGYSSLSCLKDLPIDALKIDRSFVEAMGESGSPGSLVEAMVVLAHSLNMKAIAEGVETQSQLAQLRAMGGDLVQGYLTGKPAPPDQIRLRLSGELGAIGTTYLEPSPGLRPGERVN